MGDVFPARLFSECPNLGEQPQGWKSRDECIPSGSFKALILEEDRSYKYAWSRRLWGKSNLQLLVNLDKPCTASENGEVLLCAQMSMVVYWKISTGGKSPMD